MLRQSPVHRAMGVLGTLFCSTAFPMPIGLIRGISSPSSVPGPPVAQPLIPFGYRYHEQHLHVYTSAVHGQGLRPAVTIGGFGMAEFGPKCVIFRTLLCLVARLTNYGY